MEHDNPRQIPLPSSLRTHVPPCSTSQYGANINISGSAQVHLGDNINTSASGTRAEEHFLKQLCYPYTELRNRQICQSIPSTFEWMLQAINLVDESWSCFRTWISKASNRTAGYRINGKPGSGKSTMMKFLDTRVNDILVTSEWASNEPVLRARYYFWSGGNQLQKSLEGLFRSLLYQVLGQRTDMIQEAMIACQQIELTDTTTPWNSIQLREALLSIFRQLCIDTRLLLLVDGLDECYVHEQGELINFLTEVESVKNIKFIVSSRPENIFKDAFNHCSTVQLERLTRLDVQLYVESTLCKHQRWLFMERVRPNATRSLMADILGRAEGVFLWVVLVVREILADMRAGVDFHLIQQKTSQVPQDLGQYFLRIIDSIEPVHRREASTLLQLALHEEDRYHSVFSLRLIDTFSIGYPCDHFILQTGFDLGSLNLQQIGRLQEKTETSIRKIDTRCKGLLRCVGNIDSALSYEPDDAFTPQLWESTVSATKRRPLSQSLTPEDKIAVEDNLTISVDLLHRSLRDFLLLPQNEAMLKSYTGGRLIDARAHLCNARLLQLLSLTKAGYTGDLTTGVASNVISTLSVMEWSQSTEKLFYLAGKAVERLAQSPASWEDISVGWYICASLRPWQHEKSDLISLAIDFNLKPYIFLHMTASAILSKQGRPYLDYILRPRFPESTSRVPGCRAPDSGLVRVALARGSGPNQCFDSISIWALYLCFLADHAYPMSARRHDYPSTKRTANIEAISALIDAGAAPVLPFAWLASTHPRLIIDPLQKLVQNFQRRWRVVVADHIWEQLHRDRNSLVSVAGLLKLLFEHSEPDVLGFVHRLRSQESRAFIQHVIVF